MADIATLGIKIDSSDAAKGARALDKMTGAAKRVEAAVQGVTATSTGAAAAAAKIAASASSAEAGLMQMAGAARQTQQALKMASAAANDNFKSVNKFNIGNIAAQFHDIAVSAQMGMGALQVGLQQGTQLAAVIASMENPIRGLGAAFWSVISPVSLLTIGLVSLSAAGLQMVDWPKRTAQALIFLADNLKAIAPYAATAAAALALIYAPSVIAGMVNLIAWMGRVSVAAISMGASFALANPATALVAGFAAAVIAANIFRDELKRIFGRDIVADAKNAVNWIIGAFVGGFNAAKVIWNEFPDVMNEIGALAMHNLMEQIRWGLRQMVLEVNMGLKSIGERFNITLPDLGNPNKLFPPQKGPKVSGRASNAVAKVTAAFSDAQNTDYVGGMYSAIESGASAAADKLRELAKGLTDVDDKSKKGRTRGGKTDAEYYQDIIDGADRRIASLLVEQQALGMTEEAANALRYEQEMLNQAQQHGIDLTPKQADYIKMLAGTMAGLEAATRRVKDAIDFGKDVVRGFISDMRSGLENGQGAWKSFGNAVMNVLDKIIDKIMTQLLDALFQANGLLGGLGGIFGFGGGSGISGSTQLAAAFAGGGIGLFANGGVTDKPAIFGEAGPEAAVPLPDGRHIPVKLLNAANGNTHSGLQADIRVYVDDNGNLDAKIENIARQESGKAIKQYDKASAGRFARDSKQAKMRGII